MTDLHPLAPHHLPVYLPGPDGSDPLFTAVLVFLLVILMGVGVLYFKHREFAFEGAGVLKHADARIAYHREHVELVPSTCGQMIDPHSVDDSLGRSTT